MYLALAVLFAAMPAINAEAVEPKMIYIMSRDEKGGQSLKTKYRGHYFSVVVVFVIAFSYVFLLSGCTSNISDSESSSEDYNANTPITSDENCIDLGETDSYEINEEVKSSSILVFEEAIFTNSETITVKNNSDSRIDVYLYNKDNPEQVIQQFTLDGKGSKVFSNLTSRFLYQVGVNVQTDCEICLTISK